MPKAKPTSKPLHRKNRRRRFHFEIPETRRLLAAQLDYGDAPDLGPGNAEGDEAKEQLEKAFEAGGTNNTSPSYIHYFLAMTEHHIGNADVAQEDLVRANESAEKELGGSPIGNRKLTIKSRRKEAKASIDTEGQANTKEDDNSMNN